MDRRTLFGATAAATVLATVGCGRDESGEQSLPAGSFLLTDVAVFDGERLTDANSVQVEEGMITAVGRDIPADGLPTYSAPGRTLLPGLIDCHIHLHASTVGVRESVRFGVTTVLDLHNNNYQRLAALTGRRDRIVRSNQADVWAATSAVSAPDGHPPDVRMPRLGPDDDPYAFVDDRVADGADFVKVIMEEYDLFGGGRPTLSDRQVSEVIDAAHGHGIRAITHVSTVDDAMTVAAAEGDLLAHMPFDREFTPDEVQTMLDADLRVVATAAVYAGSACVLDNPALVEDPRVAPYLTPEWEEHLLAPRDEELCFPEIHPTLMTNVGLLHDGGVPVLVGTDANNRQIAYGVSMFSELDLLVEAGMSPAAALHGATAGAADAFGITDRGRIAPGQRADLLLVDGDPTTDITTIRDQTAIWKNGHPIDRTPAA